ncbi:MAG TPA: hypothetical protein PK453_11305, partial [Leptospiraceae bacterium]|nr:hypothetical protein [Leptospiraceae bacterium]
MKLRNCLLSAAVILSALNCLKADKSPFDISSKSPVSSGFAVLSLLGASSSSKNQASETAAPSNISYGSQSSF